MTTTLPVSDIVQVAVSVAPAAPQARSFGVALVLGTSNVLPSYDRVRVYTELTGGVDQDFASNTPEYKAAAAYFGQNPAPQSLMIGRQFTAAQSGVLRGGGADQTLADYTAITNGGFDIAINGTNEQVSGVNLSGAASLTAVAALLQTALQALVASTLCTYDVTNKRFLITSPTTGAGSTIGFAVPPTHSGSPTDLSTILALTNVAGAASVPGFASESVTAAWTASKAWNPGWYGMIITSTTAQDSKDSMAFAEANKLFFMDATADANIESPTDTTNLAYYAKNQGYSRTAVFFDNVNSDKFICASAMALFMAVDYTQPNSIKILKFKQAPGYAPVVITETQRASIEGFNCNYYATFGTSTMFAQGTVGNGRFIDEVIALDWLQATVQNNVFTALYNAPTKIPQTDAGAIQLVGAVKQALEQARIAGLLASGIWTGPDTGEIHNGDMVPNGYYAFASPVSSQSASDRAARKAPPITAIGVGAGAIQSANIAFTFQR